MVSFPAFFQRLSTVKMTCHDMSPVRSLISGRDDHFMISLVLGSLAMSGNQVSLYQSVLESESDGPCQGLGPGLPTMVVLDSLLTLTCCCSRFSSCRRLFSSYRQGSRTSSKATGSRIWATVMVNLGRRVSPTTSRVGEPGHGVLLVEVEVGQGLLFQRAKHPLEQRKELRRDSRC